MKTTAQKVNHNSARWPRTRRFFSLPLEELTLHYHIYTHGEDFAFSRCTTIGKILLEGGRLTVGGVVVHEPDVGDGLVSWCQQTESAFTSGQLHLWHDGVIAEGVVYLGKKASDAVAHHVLATTIKPVEYTTQVTTKREPQGTDPDKVPTGDWKDGETLGIGFKQDPGDLTPTPVVTLAGQDVSEMTSWAINPQTSATELILNLTPDVICPYIPDCYLTGTIDFDVSQPLPTFSGKVTSTCTDTDAATEGAYLWRGKANAAGTEEAADALAAAPQRVDEQAIPLAADDLSIAELMSLVPDSSVADVANDMLQENMKWALGESSTEKEWLNEFFGENQPALSPDRQELVKKSMSWYQEDFAKSYLGFSISNYSGPNAPGTNLNSDQKLKLKYFLQTGMAKSQDFNIQQNGIYIQAFIQSKPRLDSYINDRTTDWASQLFATITSPPQLTLMVNRIYAAAGAQGTMTPVNNFSTLLTALQPSGDLARQYYGMVVNACLASKAIWTTVKDKDAVMEWLPEFLQKFLGKVASDGGATQDQKILAQQVQELIREKGGSITDAAGALVDFLIAAKGTTILEKAQNAEDSIAATYPKLTMLGKALFMIAWSMGLVMIVQAFQNWKNLTPEKKAEIIVATVQMTFSALDAVPIMIQGVKAMGLKGYNELQRLLASPKGSQNLDRVMEPVESDPVRTGASETASMFPDAGQGAQVEGTLWDTIFENAGKVVGAIGVLASAAFAVFSTIDFVNDIRSGQPITKEVFDGIIAATQIISTVCLAIDLLVATSVFAIAAAILAVVGAVVAIIAMFVVKPKNPLETFMKDTVIPFVDGLAPQDPPPSAAMAVARI